MKEEVCAVVVTHNRHKLLQEVVSSLRNQNYTLSKVIVVDNDSSDGTREWLALQTDIHSIFQNNLGGAGGFYTGIKVALEQGFEWIWVMDDDIEVAENCLETLLKYKNYSKCLHPRKKYIDGKFMPFESYMDYRTSSVMHLGDISFDNGKEICYINLGNFEGMLIHRSIVSLIGLPDYRLFVTKDDQIYGFKASLYTNVSLIRDAIIFRKKDSKDEQMSNFTLYYFLRNMHFLNDVLKYYYPKKVYIVVRYAYSYLIFVKHTLLVFTLGTSFLEKVSRLKVILKAFIDFNLKKEGKTY